MTDRTFQGVFAVLCTPFDTDGAVDEIALRSHISHLIDKGGVHGIMPTGSTGEFTALSDQEIHRVIDIAVDEVAGRVPVVAGTAAVSTKLTIERTQYAKDAGADGALIVAPYYCHPNDDEIYGHYHAICAEVDLTIMLYNNPGTSGVDMKPELITRIAQLDQVKYIKESSGDMTRLTELITRCGDAADVFCGCDTLTMEMLLMGAKGWVSPPANIIPEQCVKLYELTAVRKDIETAGRLYLELLPLFRMFESSGQYVQLVKYGLEYLGRPVGPPRPPLLPPCRESQLALEKLLKSLTM